MKNFFSRIYIPIGWTIIMEILLCLPGNNLPSTNLFKIEGFDKLVHFLFFAAFVVLWCYFLHVRITQKRKLNMAFFIIYLVAAFNGILIEYIQAHFIPFRSFDNADIIADLIGASIAYGICNVKLLTS